jgi:hypothetical protein
LERDTPAAAIVSALTFGLSMDVFVVASSNKFVLLASVQEDEQSEI